MFKNQLLSKGLLAGLAIMAASCSSKNDANPEPEGEASYIVGLGVTSNGVTTNYAIKANSLTTGTITPVGNGLTLLGYRDYSQGNNTVFALGGLGEVNVNAINQSSDGKLVLSGSATFGKSADDIQQVDDSQMLAIKYPSTADGNEATFNFVDINTQKLNKTVNSPLTQLVEGGDNPVYTGMAVRGSQLFVSYMHFDAGYNTNHVDKSYIAVYSYPALTLEKVITDTRTGPTGAWQTKNGLFKDEKGDIYAMSSSNISNGFSQSVKPGGFLRLKNGESNYDASYFFNTDLLGGKISHIKYLGNGLVFATISTIINQDIATDRWGDKKLKMAIIDVYNQKITDVKLEGGSVNDLIHDGNGGRSFPVLVDNGNVYYTITTAAGATNVYEINVANATAKKGATVQGTFVGGIFKVK